MKKFKLLKLFAIAVIMMLSTSTGWGQVVISQVYGGGGNSGATYKNDFIELFNQGSTSVDITGWSVQYSSATGTTWTNKTDLTSVILAPGQYYLIQEAAGTGGSINLPTPDVIGTIAMGGSAGKVALVNNTTFIAVACPTDASIMDFVGYGTTANCYEGAGPTPAPSNTLAVLRASNGCTDTNNNASDFATGAPNPRNTASPLNVCSSLTVATPTFAPPAGTYFTAQNVVISTTTSGASIYYTTDGSDPTESSTPYTIPVNISTNTTLKARAYKTGYNPSTIASGLYIFPTPVANLAALRASTLGQNYFISGQVILTFQQTFRNQKYIQDATAAILIDDPSGIITTSYALGDGITGIAGTLNEFGNMMQFTPLANPGAPTSSGNTITPQVITLDQLSGDFESYESELVKIANVTFTNAGDNFANGIVYPISDGSKAIFDFRTTFYDVDYIGTVIPANATITVIPNSRTEGDYVTSRSSSDIQILSNPATKLVISSVNNGSNPFANTDFNVVVNTEDAFGNPAFPANNINFNFTTNGGTLGNVAFVGGTTISGTILAGTSTTTVTGVQMAPTGTNVTITAVDANPFGLANGVSNPFDVVELFIPDIIITEVMQNPFTVTDAFGEYFEIYNNEDISVDLDGYIFKDDGTNTFTVTGSFIIAAHSFAALGLNGDNLVNGGYTCSYVYPSTFSLANGDDELVLLLPDGITEIDRIMWDGGAVWPDPEGASMIFAGLPTDDNNDGTKWITSTLREPSYTGTEGDLGSPGTLGNGQFTGVTGLTLDLKVFLEGPYNPLTNAMTTDLYTGNLLPVGQPFNPALPYYGNNAPKWLYNGTETVGAFPTGTVDYVLIELRDATSAANATAATRVAQMPALILTDGSVVALDGTSLPTFSNSITNFLYIVIWSRNHVGIMSNLDITPTGTVNYDFTTGSGQVFGGTAGYKEIEAGVWGMASGDINADGTVNATDKSPSGWKVDAGKKGYYGTDLNMNGQINNQDKNDFLYPEFTKTTGVPN